MNNKRSIAFSVTNDVVYDQRMHRIANCLAEAGYEVTIVGRMIKKSYSTDNQIYKIKRLKCWFNKGFLFYKEYNIRLLFLFLFGRPFDILCACDTDTLAGVALGGRIRGSKLVYDAHEWFTEVPELAGSAFKKRLWSMIETIYMRITDLRYTVNESLAGIFEDRFNMPFHVIRNMPSKSSISFADKEDPPVIFYQGALNEGRGLEEAIQAMKILPGFRLWLAGEGDLSGELRKMVEEYNLEDRVEFLGYLLPGDLKAITPACFIGLNTLISSSKSYYYSLANKFFDYMHAGIPSINMRFPEYELLSEQYNCCLLLDHCTPDHIAKAVTDLFADQDRYRQLVEASLAASQELNWDEEQVKLLELYKTL